MASSNLRKTASLLRALMHYTAPRGDNKIRVRIGAAFACLVAAKSSNMVTPLLYGAAVDLVNGDSGFAMSALMFLVGGYALARLGQQVFSEAKQYLFAKVAQRAVRGAALNAFRYLHKLSLQFHMDRQTGGMTRAIDRGAKGIEFLLTIAFFEVLPLFVEVVFVSIIMWHLFGGFYAGVTFLTVAAYVYFTIRVTEWRIRFRREMNTADEAAATRAVDSLLNYETVKYFNAEDVEAARYDSAMADYEVMAVRSRTSLSVVNIGQGTIIAFGLMAVMAMAGADIQKGNLTVGDFVAVNTYLLQLYLPLNFLGWVYRELRQALVDMERMFGLLDEEPGIADKPAAKPIKIDGGELIFDSVHFAYGDRPILKGVSFTVKPGKRVAIVGPSGSGKTTISRLLFRFYDPVSGAVRLDGQDLRDVTQASVRAAIGVVPQDTVMFNSTIGYNIGYGRNGASQNDIAAASKMASIDQFIAGLPDGYDTMVGERGLKLSGGEKQRIAIARAILKKPSIFLFDEATSALDSRTEKEIQHALDTVSKSQTTLVIAHRLSTIVNADEIIVLAEGEIIERGTHRQLLSQKGLYAQMWERQSSGFHDDELPSNIMHDKAGLQGV
ncbi:ABC transporter ATP-binding protein/permease [Alphaproteobacteria bacterium]|jgi:ABC-type transport system involved in Fe-S cluster assembly fused permease/ATPase subunit|nr:ABC transporter ATP-binding protein/permease [Alphaproteobacteria bacterium]MDB2637807.1 ABC transporter ATP-binding protein/permease [Alphaproteobacteria bacterium]MDC1037226.1 ABC transporter ATP-binding protein/permease [Alphaproteobacteria bacterium]MDC3193139.1 ABC transporter ATP-binding protein/permease [Alphaproteobacteria bacterium]